MVTGATRFIGLRRYGWLNVLGSNKMSSESCLTLKFWGVRGSIACPGPNTVRYGGNTSCVEVRCGEHLLIFDAGTGMRELAADRVG